jgi:aminotransferase EvaB
MRPAVKGKPEPVSDLPLQPNGSKVQWSYLPKQFSPENIEQIFDLMRKFVPTGDFTLGKPLEEFEGKFARLIGAKHAIGVNSGTDALKLSLKALGVGHGDEVITTANTFIATVGAIAELGAQPVFVDCTDNFCMDVSQVEAKITPKTKAIMPVHFAGQMTDMRQLREIAQKHNLPVVEDSCQCILGNIEGKNAGTWGNAGGFSLHPLKNLNVWGDGGMIVTSDDALADRLKKIRNHGLANRDEVVMMGCNSRLDTLQAVIGNWLIEQVDFITNTRIKHAKILDEGLGRIPEITLPERFTDRKLVFHLYMVFAERRDELVKFCVEQGVQAKVHYPVPVYLQPAVRQLCSTKPGDFPMADRHAASLISFPAHEHLTEDQVYYMIDAVERFYRG